MPFDQNVNVPPPPPGAPHPQRSVHPTGPFPVGASAFVPESSGHGIGAMSMTAAPFIPGTSARAPHSLASASVHGTPQAQQVLSSASVGPATSVAYAPFVPRGHQQQTSSSAVPFVPGGVAFKANAAPFVPGGTSGSSEPPSAQGGISLPSDDDFTLGLTDLSITAQGSGGGVAHPPQGPPPSPPYAGHVGGGGYSSSTIPAARGGVSHQPDGGAHVRHAAVYTRPPPVASGQTLASSRSISDQLQAELRQRAFLEQAQVDPNNEDTADLPQVLNQYHSLVPLEDLSSEEPSYALGLRSGVLKGVSSVDGMAYALRRIDHRQVIPSPELTAAAREAVDRWATLMGHPHIASLRATFVSADMWEAPALYFAHDYHAGALSLEAVHCGVGEGCTAASEPELWSYAMQLCCILRAVHGAGLAAGGGATLAPSKVLLCPTGVAVSGGMNTGNRLRLTGVGAADVIRPETVGIIGGQGIVTAQRDDLIAAGQLLALLACGPTQVPLSDPVAAASHRCTQPLGRLIYGLATGSMTDCAMFSQLLTPVAFDALEAERAATDRLKSELAKELENGRLLRLLIKLAFVNERPDGDMDSEWAETGDRYILKLFRDFVFHQHNDEGAPLMDWGHVFESLNKLDVGVPEKVLLLSRDEMSMLVASYADIKACVEGAYAELVQASKMAGTRARVERQQREMVDRFHINHQ